MSNNVNSGDWQFHRAAVIDGNGRVFVLDDHEGKELWFEFIDSKDEVRYEEVDNDMSAALYKLYQSQSPDSVR